MERPDFKNCVGIGILRSDGELVAGLVFSDWNPGFKRIEFSGATDDPRAFSTQIRRSVADYVFGQLEIFRVWSRTSADNRRALRLLEGIGFIREGTQAHWYGEGKHAVVLRVTEPEWRRKWGSVPLRKAA